MVYVASGNVSVFLILTLCQCTNKAVIQCGFMELSAALVSHAVVCPGTFSLFNVF